MPLKPVHYFKTTDVMILIPDAGYQRKDSHPPFCAIFLLHVICIYTW